MQFAALSWFKWYHQKDAYLLAVRGFISGARNGTLETQMQDLYSLLLNQTIGASIFVMDHEDSISREKWMATCKT